MFLVFFKVQVTAIANSEEASFFESFEAAHSNRDLSSFIAKVFPLFLLSLIWSIITFLFIL